MHRTLKASLGGKTRSAEEHARITALEQDLRDVQEKLRHARKVNKLMLLCLLSLVLFSNSNPPFSLIFAASKRPGQNVQRSLRKSDAARSSASFQMSASVQLTLKLPDMQSNLEEAEQAYRSEISHLQDEIKRLKVRHLILQPIFRFAEPSL